MIEAVRIRNWQSLKHADLQLGRYTVIVGASSSGKTALMRAFRALASNVRGNGQLTRGTSTAAISAVFDEGEVTLEYRSGAWRYHVVHLGHEETYTKLNGAVPAHITNLLQIAPVPSGGTSINFAGQFDRPYLLSSDDSGAKVARVFGELTNVHIILDAVREANRRRSSLAATLKVRQGDLDALVPQVGRFQGLPARLDALKAAEQAHRDAVALSGTVTRLRSLLDDLRAAQGAAQLRALPALPDDAAVRAAQDRRTRLAALLGQYTAAVQRARQARETVKDRIKDGLATEVAFHDALRTAGECPTCGQTTTDRIQTVTSTL